MNTEELIRRHAERMAERMLKIARAAQSEEDVRHEVNILIDQFVEEAELDVRGRHEYGLAGGRVDSKYGGVIIEYKTSHGSGSITEDPQAPGTKAVVKQIKERFADLHREEHVDPQRIFGVGCDGDTLVFVRKRGTGFEVELPQPVTPHSVERLLRALLSVGAQGRSYTPDALAQAFGSESALAQTGIRDLYLAIVATTDPRALTFFQQWKILFGEVCGYDVEGRNTKVQKLAEHYGVTNAQPAPLLFAVHTYYAIVMKFLAAEIVGSLKPLGLSDLKRAVASPTSQALLAHMTEMERGGIWAQLGITNFLEGDLFAWYLSAWNDNVDRVVRDIARELDGFDPDTLSVEPAESRDLLKKLYQNLFPKPVRHDLGEYYTPDWLAELTLNELGYDGDPDKRLLDPACGSGTFLVMALNRVRAWFQEHRHECGFREPELVEKVLSNIIGFDLNPLAVMAARTNYLMAIRDLLPHARGGVELPVYMCDSIVTPAELGQLFSGAAADRRTLRTAVGELHLPTDVSRTRQDVATWAATLEHSVAAGYTAEEFLTLCVNRGLHLESHDLHRTLFEQLRMLQAQGRNGIWARIIKNAFAPLFVGEVDYVAGNPPWVNWESLPEAYRDDTKPLWVHYGLFTLSGAAARLGGGKKDLAMLFVYVAADKYLRDGGRLGYVITQSVFKTQGAGDGFRRFEFSDHANTVRLRPVIVHDLSAIQVFEGATNRTAVFVCEKSRRALEYPVPYTVWSRVERIHQGRDLSEVLAKTTRSAFAAAPVQPTRRNSPWLTAPEGAVAAIQRAMGGSTYRGYEGANAGGLNGCYWVRVLERLPSGELLIENLHDVGKIKVESVRTAIEPDLVYPLVRGRDVGRWRATPSAHIILAQDPTTRLAVPEGRMKAVYPKVYAYLRHFEPQLRQRKTSMVRRQMETGPFYSMFAVGPYTVAPWKVVWRDMGTRIQAAVLSEHEGRVVVPEHHVMFVPLDDPQEAHYLCACLNSAPSECVIASYTTTTGISTHVLEHVAVPKFDPSDPTHTALSDLSQRAHEAAAAGDAAGVAEIEREVDRLAAQLWGITDEELVAIQEALAGTTPQDEEEEDEEEG